MSRAVDLHNQLSVAANEVGELRPNRVSDAAISGICYSPRNSPNPLNPSKPKPDIKMSKDFSDNSASRLLDEIIALKQDIEKLFEDGRYPEAILLAEIALAGTEELPISYKPEIIDHLLMDLGILYDLGGLQIDAEALFKKSLSISEKYKDPFHPDIAKTLSYLAKLYLDRDAYSDAEPLLRRVLSILELAGDDEKRNIAAALNNLGRLYYNQGRYKEAAPLFERSVDLLSTLKDVGETDMAAALNNYASLRQAQGFFDEAESLFKRSLFVLENSHRPDASNVAAAANNLAVFYHSRGRFDAAERLYKHSLALTEGGKNHLREATTLLNLSSLYQDIGRLDEARALRIRAQRLAHWDIIDIPIMVATNRRVEAAPAGLTFGHGESRDPREINFGIGFVRTPKEDVKNRAIRRANAFGLLHSATGRQTSASNMIVGLVEPRQTATTIAAMARHQASHAVRFAKQALVLVHGYNSSFNDAMRRTAMITFDLDFDGAIFLFTWPSQAQLCGYRIDRKRARIASPFLLSLFELIGTELPNVKVNVLAHSTGAEIALSALSELASNADPKSRPQLGELILAHADVDPARLARQMPELKKLGMGVTSYSSAADWAMTLARLIRFKRPRVGSRPVNIAGVDAIDVTDLSGGPLALNHTVFVENPLVFGDIARLLATGERPPNKRTPLFQAVNRRISPYWRYGKPT